MCRGDDMVGKPESQTWKLKREVQVEDSVLKKMRYFAGRKARNSEGMMRLQKTDNPMFFLS